MSIHVAYNLKSLQKTQIFTKASDSLHNVNERVLLNCAKMKPVYQCKL